MSNLKEIRSRISSVKSTRQITGAMKMVAAAKLRKAQDAIIQMRPYADKLQEVLSNLNKVSEIGEENIYSQTREIKNVLIIPITSNKGLCGGFNSSVVKNVINQIKTKYPEHYKKGNVHLFTFGRKGKELLNFKGYKSTFSNTEIFENLNFNDSSKIADSLMKSFATGEYDVIEVIYNKFKNAAVQELTIEQYLPVIPTNTDIEHQANTEYIFEPTLDYIINYLIPKSLRIQFYKYLLDSNTSEHGARMTAMHLATDNATELIGNLTLQYNKARQAAITREIVEIVSGAEALKG